jgi:hypothetical protein
MADRYWVGGASTWNTTSTNRWSATSGGASGASVPTVADNVFFDQAGTYTVTMTGALECLNITVSAGTVTFATGTAPTLNIAGSMSVIGGTVWNSTGAITFSATSGTYTIAGPASGGAIAATSIQIGPTGSSTATWTLTGALYASSGTDVTVASGTFATGGFVVDCGRLISSGTSVRAINLGASDVQVRNTGNAIDFTTPTNLTVTAGTSVITLNASSSTFSGGGLTFYQLTTLGSANITGANTFDRIRIFASAAIGTNTVTINAPQTTRRFDTAIIGGTPIGNRRIFVSSATYGISQTLTVTGTVSIFDIDFRGIYVIGASAPISGTRIGNRGECSGITFDAPKTVYWNLAGAQNWSAPGWATASGGSTNVNNFPLPQDTATFNNASSVTGTITLDTAIGYVPTVDMSTRTTAMTLGIANATTVYGDWKNGSGTSFSGASTLTFSGGNTQTITSAAKIFPSPITVDTYGGTVQLDSALNIGANTLTITNGTFTTNGYTITAGVFSSSNSNVRTINLGASVVTLSSVVGFGFTTTTNLTFNAGSSAITLSINTSGSTTFNLGGLTYNSVTFTNASAGTLTSTIAGQNTFTNLTLAGTNVAANIQIFLFSLPQTVTGTLTCAGSSAVQRIFLRSDTLGTSRTLQVNSLSATDCDFRDIALTGTASGSTPTRAGDCGGNSGITFDAPKTVYWNLAGAQNWSATGWATSSAGSPAVNNFPLAQDTAVFDNAGSVTGTITINLNWNIGTFDASVRSSAMTLTTGTTNPVVYGDWKFGAGVTLSSTTGAITFSKNGTQTITSNAVQFGTPVAINHPSGTVQLADGLSLGATRTLTLTSGTFNAVTYNVATGLFSSTGSTNTVRMGSGTWTLSGTGTVWNCTTAPTLIAGTSNIVLSDTSATARTFSGGGLYYNKLTIGGATGGSTLTINGVNTFGELASTKTVAHTIIFASNTTNTIGKWSVTGTVGNVVTVGPTVAATTYTLSIAGPANTGIDYLSISYCAVSGTSPGEFYVGANSTNTAGNTGSIIFTATPAARTLYWVGGAGNWSSTTKWSTSSGGASGAAIPTSLDAVNFDTLSNATAYTATIDAGVTLARCASFTMAGPAAGNVTFAGTVGIAYHGNVSFAATGITRTYTGNMNWAGNSSYTFNTNGLALSSSATVNGVGSTWALGFNTDIGGNFFTVTYGTFTTSASNYSFTTAGFASSNTNVRSVLLNGSTISLSGTGGNAINTSTTTNLTWTSGSSQITLSAAGAGINSGGVTFNNVSLTSAANTVASINGANTFNNLTFAGRTTVGITPVTFSGDQTINGTLTVSAGTGSAYRTFLASNTLGTARTLTCAAVSATDVDFRDITLAGAYSPASPFDGRTTRIGNCQGNSGIRFPDPKTVYWAVAGGGNWGATGNGSWTDTSGNPAVITQFPLPQDTAYFPFATPNDNVTVTVNDNYNIGTIDMSNRNGSARVTLSTGITLPTIYGNWINGTGTTLTGSLSLIFSGRGAQTITSSGRTFAQRLSFSCFGGSVTLQDDLVCSGGGPPAIAFNAGTFNANNFNVTLTDGTNGRFDSSGTNVRTIAFGSGTWTLPAGWSAATSTNLTVTGTATINITGATSKTFSGGNLSYSGITLNQGGAGTLTINGNNTFKTITNTYSATGATSIALGNTTQTLTNPWTATGAATRVLTVSGTSAASPGTLIYTGAGTAANVDYLSISNVRAYDIFNEWYAGNNSTNGGSLGWYFVSAGGTVYAATITESGTGTDSIIAGLQYLGTISETGTITDSAIAGLRYLGTVTELATSSDAFAAAANFRGVVSESGTGSDTISAQSALGSAILESATIADTDLARLIARATIDESATGTDTDSAGLRFLNSISETATGTETVTSRYIAQPNIAESATGTDTDSAALTASSAISETATGTDLVSAQAAFLAAVAESATITDLIDSLKGYFVYIIESASASDTVFSRYIANPTIAESASITDAVAARYIALPSIFESAAGSDIIIGGLRFTADVAESATGADTVLPGQGFTAFISESVTGTDLSTTRATFRSSIVEYSSVIEFVRAYFVAAARVTELATGTDQVRALRSLAARVVETATLTDSLSAKVRFLSRIQEVATAQEAVNAPGSIYKILMQEVASAQDAVTTKATFRSSLTETATGTETNRAAFIPRATITESATITDAASALPVYAARILETSAAADSVLVAPSIFNAIAVASATALDNINAPGSIYNVTVPESATLSDSVIGAFLWNLIDDSQGVNWQNVVSEQSVTWNSVANNQTAGWNNVDNSQSTSWGNIQDDQDPDWVDIPTLK